MLRQRCHITESGSSCLSLLRQTVIRPLSLVVPTDNDHDHAADDHHHDADNDHDDNDDDEVQFLIIWRAEILNSIYQLDHLLFLNSTSTVQKWRKISLVFCDFFHLGFWGDLKILMIIPVQRWQQ